MINITDDEFKNIVNYMQYNFGINMTEKRDLIESRLQNTLLENNFSSFSEYFRYILSDSTGEVITNLVNKLTTNFTSFLRETQHFDFLVKNILPDLSNQLIHKDLRIWSAGCSTGQEPYTIAMTLADYFGEDKQLWDTRVLATDISNDVLNIAQNGVYKNEHISTVPNMWKQKYFNKLDNANSVVVDKIKQDVIFRKFNLNNDIFPFKSKFHVIFCRNVMIYFDAPTTKKLIDKFYEQTEPGGYLFIGHTEIINKDETKYKFIMPAIYRKE